MRLSLIDLNPAGSGEVEIWKDENSGLYCMANLNGLGCWCGYVGIGAEHRDFGKDIKDCPDFDVHGGITFAGQRSGLHTEELRRLWWFGFDCCHDDDIIPKPGALYGSFITQLGIPPQKTEATYKEKSYVKRHCERLALQLSGGFYND